MGAKIPAVAKRTGTCVLVLLAVFCAFLHPIPSEASSRDKKQAAQQEPGGRPERDNFSRSALLVSPAGSLPEAAPSAQSNNGTAVVESVHTLQEGALYRVELPPVVLLGTSRDDGMDMGVFNAQDKSIPFAVRSRGWADTRTTHTLTSLYPLWGKPHSSTDDLVVSFTLDADSRLVPKITGGKEVAAPEGQELKGYVIPLPEEGIPASSMSFVWEKGQENTVQFTVQTSNDLRGWHTLLARAALVRFDGPDGPLESSAISLNGLRLGKYVRLLFDDGMSPAAISKITLEQWSSARQSAVYGPVQPVLDPEVRATAKTAYRAPGLVYSLPQNADGNGSLPSESLHLAEAKAGQYAAVKVFTRRTKDAPWRFMGNHTFFAIMRGDTLLQSKPLALDGQQLGEVRLEAQAGNGSLPEGLALSVSYTPQDLYFLAQGQGPYSLVWNGKRSVPRDSSGIFTLAAQGGDVQSAALGAIQSPSPAANPKEAGALFQEGTLQYILWGVLGVGVLLLGGMALSLARRMR